MFFTFTSQLPVSARFAGPAPYALRVFVRLAVTGFLALVGVTHLSPRVLSSRARKTSSTRPSRRHAAVTLPRQAVARSLATPRHARPRLATPRHATYPPAADVWPRNDETMCPLMILTAEVINVNRCEPHSSPVHATCSPTFRQKDSVRHNNNVCGECIIAINFPAPCLFCHFESKNKCASFARVRRAG